MEKLLTIDGLAIVRRVYEASSQEAEPFDKVEPALRHSLSSFKKLLAAHQPSHVLAVFEDGGPTWRHALYPPYRSNRLPVPAELQASLPGFHAALAGIGVAVVVVPQVEAEDVMATAILHWMAEQRGEAVVASSAKNLLILLAQGATIWDHFKGEWHDRAWLEKKFAVRPEQVPDLLALMGNPSKGIPGVSKVGIKAAARLLQHYDTLEGVMAGAGILMNPLGENLRRERQAALLYRRLASLKTDVRLGVTWNRLAFAPRMSYPL